jgi:4-aminobutyrate aminotransferase-like enzyme
MPQTKKTTAKKTTKKATEAPAAPKLRVPAQIVELQRRALEQQRSFFGRTYDAVSTMSERQEDAFNSQLEKASFVPEPFKELATTWTESQRQMRGTYREAVDKSYALLDEWVGGFAEAESREA